MCDVRLFQKVWRDSDLMSPPGRFIQTISVPPGGSSVVDVHPVVPGTYTLVDHAIFRLDKVTPPEHTHTQRTATALHDYAMQTLESRLICLGSLCCCPVV